MASKGSEVISAERRIKALELRKDGWSYRAIAAELNVSVATAHRDIGHCLKELNRLEQDTTEEWRRLELERLDACQIAIAQQVKQGNFAAIDRWLRISEQRCKLLNLYDDLNTHARKLEAAGFVIIDPSEAQQNEKTSHENEQSRIPNSKET